MRLFDAHNHIQDERLLGDRGEMVRASIDVGVAAMVVNATSEADWDAVERLAASHPEVVPSFGVHPWHIAGLAAGWQERLVKRLRRRPSAVGEIGIDHFREGLDRGLQERVFLEQLQIAVEERLPVSIHGLRAWGRLYDLLRAARTPAEGFLLHSYGGPSEMVGGFADLGAYFSFSGAFLRPGRESRTAVFRGIPRDRLLVETDAPYQALPLELDPCRASRGLASGALNHPATIGVTYCGLARVLGINAEELAGQAERNFRALFRKLLPEPARAP